MRRPISALFPALLVVLLVVLGSSWSAARESTDDPVGPVVRVRIDSILHPPAAEFVVDALGQADARGAELFVLELNTPGGLLPSTRDIFEAMMAARTPVVVYVAPSGAQAASAGFFLLMAADVAAMAPGTNTGAAHPVGGQGEDIEGHLGEKVEQDAAATIRSLALQHGRDVPLAEAAVLESRSFTADEALEANLVEIVAPTFAALLVELDGREIVKHEAKHVPRTLSAAVEEIEMTVFQRLLSAIVHPNIAYLLMALGWIGLYMELSNPGAILPGVVGILCLIVGFYAMSVLPVNYAGVALIVLAMVLFVAEFQVMSHGALTLGGAVALILGSLMLFEDPDPALRVGTEVVVGAVTGVLLVVGFLLSRVLALRKVPVRTGREGMLQEHGVVRRDLAPRGKVFVHGELWAAELAPGAESAPRVGEEVEVVEVDGMILRVRPVNRSRPVTQGRPFGKPASGAPEAVGERSS